MATLGAGSGQTSRTGAGGGVDNEAAGGAEAARSEVGAVAVAGEDEQGRAFRGGHDFSFGAAGALCPGARAPKAVGCGEELAGGGGGQVFQPGAGVALGAGAAEQPDVGARGRCRRPAGR